MLGESASHKQFNGFNLPLSVMLLREPIEPSPSTAPQPLVWHGVEAITESYRKYNQGKKLTCQLSDILLNRKVTKSTNVYFKGELIEKTKTACQNFVSRFVLNIKSDPDHRL